MDTVQSTINQLRTEERPTLYTFGLQILGLVLGVSGLATLPIGDRPYEVPNDRLQLMWFITIWSVVCSGAGIVGITMKNSSWLLMSLMLMAITSTIMIVSTNLFSGFTRTCHHCPGKEGSSAFSYHTTGEDCPYYVSYCEQGRSLYTVGAVFQCLSLYVLMFIVALKRTEIENKEVDVVETNLQE
eukprot:c15672_g1_i1.p1 GENE.c15672_g1_i1~~c15672_g1_i1.p1  ORF type:complete len:203 (-),score=36.82 c15672_g1_i1:187-741(-)